MPLENTCIMRSAWWSESLGLDCPAQERTVLVLIYDLALLQRRTPAFAARTWRWRNGWVESESSRWSGNKVFLIGLGAFEKDGKALDDLDVSILSCQVRCQATMVGPEPAEGDHHHHQSSSAARIATNGWFHPDRCPLRNVMQFLQRDLNF